MAQNSIAKLAVQITTDTAGMKAGFQQAASQTKQFASGIQFSTGKFNELGKQAIAATGSLGRIGPLAGSMGAIAGPVGVAAAAVTAMGIGLARAADASEDFRIEKLREFGQISPDVKTLADNMASLREQFGIFAEGTGLSLKPVVASIRDLAREFNVLLYGEEKVRQLEKANKYASELAGKMAEQKKREEEAARAAQEAADALKRKQDEIKRTGESITKSLRTPEEIFRDTLAELKQLADLGAISGETMSRGISKAADAFRDTTNSVKELKREAQFAPALELGTAAARTSILKSQFPARPDAATAKASLEVEKKIQAAVEAIAKRKPIIFKTASL